MYKYLFIISLLVLQNCKQSLPSDKRAFYYWKTTYSFDTIEKQLANEMQVKKFYLKCFDVDWSETRGEAIPVGKLDFGYWWADGSPLLVEEYVPCFFITNTVMLKSTKEQLDTLASRIKKKSLDILSDIYHIRTNSYERPDEKEILNFKELQIDCDWTPNSKENYFYFLKKMKEVFPDAKLSVTLRLWQLKYQQKAGIPPADKVMLMCYSTGNPKEYDIENSLASYEDIYPYIKDQSYRLQLDIALPVYNWAVLFRNKKFKGILRSLNAQEILSDSINYTHIKDNRFFFKSDQVIENTYIRYGDEIRLESLENKDVNKLIDLLKKEKLCSSESTLAFFAWDTTYIKNYGKENIQSYFDRFDNN